MNATTVNNLANYTLQDSQGNVYHLTNPGYTSGTTATLPDQRRAAAARHLHVLGRLRRDRPHQQPAGALFASRSTWRRRALHVGEPQ